MSWTDYGIEKIKRDRLLIGLNGVAQSGKDTVGKILCDSYGFERLAFADAVREGLLALNPIIPTYWHIESQHNYRRLQDLIEDTGWDKAKVGYSEVRELLQRYGTEAGRKIHGDNCWTDIILRTLRANPTTNYVITDVRFPNELKMVRNEGGVLVQIQREGVTSVNNHISDAILDEALFNHIIKNNGTLEQLAQAVNDLVMEIDPNYQALLTKRVV